MNSGYRMRVIEVVLAGAFLLAACGMNALPQTPTSVPASTALPAVVLTPGSGTADQVVADFLVSLQKDPSGADSLDYLSSSLRADVESGHLLPEIVGIQNTYQTFDVAAPQVDDATGLAIVNATLNAGSPIRHEFVLLYDNSQWRISTIVSYIAPTRSVSNDFHSATLTILAYLQALENGQPATAQTLLTPDEQAAISDADMTQAIAAIHSITATSLTLTKAQPDRLIYAAMVWVQPNVAQRSAWTAGSNERWFELRQTAEGWRIAQIAVSPVAFDEAAGIQWQPVTIGDMHLSLEVPGDWQRGTAWSWAPAGDMIEFVGVNWEGTDPSWQETGMLPDHSTTTNSTPVDVGWAKGTSYTVKIIDSAASGGGVVAYETHIIVRDPTVERAYDFYAGAPTLDRLTALESILQHMLDVAQLS